MRDRELVLAVWANRAPGSTQKNRRQTVAFRWSCHPQVPSKALFSTPSRLPLVACRRSGSPKVGPPTIIIFTPSEKQGENKGLTFTLVVVRRKGLRVAPFAGHAAALRDAWIFGVAPVAPLELQRDIYAAKHRGTICARVRVSYGPKS